MIIPVMWGRRIKYDYIILFHWDVVSGTTKLRLRNYHRVIVYARMQRTSVTDISLDQESRSWYRIILHPPLGASGYKRVKEVPNKVTGIMSSILAWNSTIRRRIVIRGMYIPSLSGTKKRERERERPLTSFIDILIQNGCALRGASA